LRSRAEAERGHDGRLEFLEHVDGKTFSVRFVIHSGPKAIRLIALDTVDDHRRSSGAERWNEVAVWLCIAVFDGVEEKAGIDKGILSAIPSVSAFAIEARFANANMLNSISRARDKGSHLVNTNKLQFRKRLHWS
jgi:hypothetical protein